MSQDSELQASRALLEQEARVLSPDQYDSLIYAAVEGGLDEGDTYRLIRWAERAAIQGVMLQAILRDLLPIEITEDGSPRCRAGTAEELSRIRQAGQKVAQ